MLHEQRRDVSGQSPADLREEYDAQLRDVIEDRGVDAVADEAGVDRSVVAALADGDSPELSFEAAAAIQALDPDAPDAATIEDMATEHLLLGMSTAVLDVDAIASEMEGDLSGKAIQQKLERRAPMTLDEFVRLEHFIVSKQW